METVGGGSSSLSSMLVSLRRRRRDKHCIVHRIDPTPLYLDVSIRNINGIEPFRPANSNISGLESRCIYSVVLWLENPAAASAGSSSSIGYSNSKARETNIICSDSSAIDLEWRRPQNFEFRLDPAVLELEKLKLEVIRIGYGDEIGNSQGKRVVGRASIKIKKFAFKDKRSYQMELVRTRTTGTGFECTREGRVLLDLKLTREYRLDYEEDEEEEELMRKVIK